MNPLIRTCTMVAVVVGGCGGQEPVPTIQAEPLWTIDGVAPCRLMSATTGDVNGDSRRDVAILSHDCAMIGGSSNSAEFRIYLGSDAGIEREPAVVEDLGLTGFDSLLLFVALGDMNGDGRDDVHLTGFREAAGRAYLATTDPARPLAPYVAAPGVAGFLWDIDGDGIEEIIAGRGEQIVVFDWDRDVSAFSQLALGPGTAASVPGDVDGDGRYDLAILGADAVAIHPGCAPGPGCELGVSTTPIETDLVSLPVFAGDPNGDGRDDVAVRTATGVLEIHLSDESGRPGAVGWRLYPDPIDLGYSSLLSIGDFDRDGRTGDAAVGTGQRVLLFRSGQAALEAEPIWEWALPPASVSPLVATDLDRDGTSDLLTLVYDPEPSGPVSLVGFSGGRPPAGAPTPHIPDGFACSLHGGDLPDIGVDRDLLARSLGVHRESFEPGACAVVEGCVGQAGERKLLDFSVAVQNFGGAPAVLPGPELAPELYAFDECHEHNHLIDFASYELLDATGQVVVAGRKQGYFLIDVFAYCDVEPAQTAGEPYDYLFISPGWADIYAAGLECQWIDITSLPDGVYQLRVSVDLADYFVEDEQIANEASVQIRITGDSVTLEG